MPVPKVLALEEICYREEIAHQNMKKCGKPKLAAFSAL